jgi:hypothetical protein
MTTDEFTGHLLAALHGPKAPEIAARVLTVLAEIQDGDPVAPQVAASTEALATAMLGDLQQSVWSLQALAHLERVNGRAMGRQLTVREVIEVGTMRASLLEMVRSEIRANFREVDDGEQAAAALFLSLDEKDGAPR